MYQVSYSYAFHTKTVPCASTYWFLCMWYCWKLG